MKEAIVKYFRCDRSYAGAVDLYMRYGNRIGLKKMINMQPENDHLTAVLHEELRILAEIDPGVFRVLVSVPVEKEVQPDPTPMPEENHPAEKAVTEVPETQKQEAPQKKTKSSPTSPKVKK